MILPLDTILVESSVRKGVGTAREFAFKPDTFVFILKIF
jgi:hypothetical protein